MTDDNAWRELSAPSNEAWDQQAVPWDTRMAEDDNDFHLMLVRPATESLLSIKPGERVLDVACGNGIFSRRLARLGAHVTAIDVSPTLIERARARGDSEDDIDYRLIDATSESQLLALGESKLRCCHVQHGVDGSRRYRALGQQPSSSAQRQGTMRLIRPCAVHPHP
jgi:SAM-dependent methyltransferase